MEMKIQEITKDLSRIKKYVHILEEENVKLKEELALQLVEQNVMIQEGEQDVTVNLMEERSPEAFERLNRLYQNGFHVCNISFGSQREEQCLFCAALLRRAGGE